MEIGDPHCNAGLSMLAYALARIRDFEACAHPVWTLIGGTLKSYREKERVKSVIAIDSPKRTQKTLNICTSDRCTEWKSI